MEIGTIIRDVLPEIPGEENWLDLDKKFVESIASPKETVSSR
jgi:hypothetical protein